MHVEVNKAFGNLLSDYNLPKSISFEVELPKQVKDILEQEITATDRGMTLGNAKLPQVKEVWENRSIIEDSENHFHVDWFADDEKSAFMLGVKTTMLLAEKFRSAGLQNICCTYSFQTPAMCVLFEKANNLFDEGDEHYISDRLSFHTKREGEEVIDDKLFNSPYWAIMNITI